MKKLFLTLSLLVVSNMWAPTVSELMKEFQGDIAQVGIDVEDDFGSKTTQINKRNPMSLPKPSPEELEKLWRQYNMNKISEPIYEDPNELGGVFNSQVYEPLTESSESGYGGSELYDNSNSMRGVFNNQIYEPSGELLEPMYDKPQFVRKAWPNLVYEPSVNGKPKLQPKPSPEHIKTFMQNLDLSGKNITIISPNRFKGHSKVRTLDLDNNNIRIILPNTFKNLRDLRTLVLRDNSLISIRAGAFNCLNQLKVLSLSDNKISTILPDTFKGLNELRTLDLSDNPLKNIHAGAFKDLSKLSMLYLPDDLHFTIKNTISFEIKKVSHFVKIVYVGGSSEV